MRELTQEERATLELFDQSVRSKEDKTSKKPSASELSRMIGISDSSVSQIKSGSYLADPGAQIKKIEEYFRNERLKSSLPKMEDYVETSISRQIYKDLQSCQSMGTFAFICGDPGVGKTKTLQKYGKDHPNSSLYLKVDSVVGTAGAMLRLLAKKLRVPMGRTNDQLQDAIKSQLHDGMILLVDEAQRLNYQTIEILRDLSDSFAEEGQRLGVALLGHTDLYQLVQNTSLIQVWNRAYPKKEYRAQSVRRNDIKLLFPAVAEDSRAVTLLFRTAKTPEGIRGVSRLFTVACSNENISYDGLLAVMREMKMVPGKAEQEEPGEAEGGAA